MTNEKQRIRVGITEMDFPHQGKTLTAVHPFDGLANSRTLQNLIKQEGYMEPTAAQLTSFVNEYFNGNEPRAKEVNQIMKYRYFRGFTGILYVPKEGLAHFIDYPEFDINSYVDKNNLLKRLDESHAQIPFEHFEEHFIDWRKIAKHPYFIAWAGGEEGAEKLAELASKHPKQEAYIFVLDIPNLKEPIAKVASLYSSDDGDRLVVGSVSPGDDYQNGFAFGVLKD